MAKSQACLHRTLLKGLPKFASGLVSGNATATFGCRHCALIALCEITQSLEPQLPLDQQISQAAFGNQEAGNIVLKLSKLLGTEITANLNHLSQPPPRYATIVANLC